MILTILSYVVVFIIGFTFGMAIIAILGANNKDPRSDKEQIEYLKKLQEKNKK